MPQTATISIYLQAVGGHFLGSNAYNPGDITVALSYVGNTINIPYQLTTHFSDDGNVSPYFTDGASSYLPIITMPPPPPAAQIAAVHFLSPDFTTVAARATIALPLTVEVATLTVSIPTTMGMPIALSQQLMLNPAQPAYTIIVPVAGLYLSAASVSGSIAVFVKMMCGCPVTPGPPASLWPYTDFTVYANVLDRSGSNTSYVLTYDTAQTGNSLFTAPLLQNQKPIQLIIFTAFQKSTGNSGVLVVQVEK
jgi:hypothetical protein